MSQVLPSLYSRRTVDAFARTVSDILSPPVLAVPALLVCAVYGGLSRTVHLVPVYLILAVGIPMFDVIRLVRQGRITDFHLPVRSERVRPFLLSVCCGLLALGCLVLLGAPHRFLLPITFLLLQTLVLFLITLFWQISIHTSTIAGLVTFAFVCFGPVALCLIPLIPLVSWSRIHLGRHTVAQTVAGALLGVACFAVLGIVQG